MNLRRPPAGPVVPASNWPRFKLLSRDRKEAEGSGAVAQLGERLICIQEVAGSIPTSSTSGRRRGKRVHLSLPEGRER